MTDVIVYNSRIKKSETLGDLKGVLCMMENFGSIQEEYSDIAYHTTVVGKIKGLVGKPDIVGILIELCLLIYPGHA
ncbi:MAG: hypothetical protein DRH24_14035 [Deltaproteobacteria bacterium]|nr:MAG: hypothetical protein DRH24_14035 [Deltaproteobacteria bacterium]